jgi:hypothetical protein
MELLVDRLNLFDFARARAGAGRMHLGYLGCRPASWPRTRRPFNGIAGVPIIATLASDFSR